MKRKMKFVKVFWIDACSSDDWSPIDVSKDDKPCNIVSVGHLVSKDEKGNLVLALSYDEENDQISQTLVIPMEFVTKIRTLK